MTITIKSNGKITGAKITELTRKNNAKINTTTHEISGEIYMIEFDFIPSDLWRDLEIWLDDGENNKNLDYAKMNLSKRNKMQFSKG